MFYTRRDREVRGVTLSLETGCGRRPGENRRATVTQAAGCRRCSANGVQVTPQTLDPGPELHPKSYKHGLVSVGEVTE